MLTTLNRRAFVGAATAFTGIALLSRPAGAAEYTFKYASPSTPEHPTAVRMVQVANEVKEKSNGRMEIQLFVNNALGGDAAMLSQLRTGAIQLYGPIGATIAQVAPLADIESIPFAFRSQTDALRALDGELGDSIRADLAAKGMHPFHNVMVNGFRQMSCNRGPIRTAADVEGLKMRTPVSALSVDFFRAIGAAPTPVSASESYTSLQTHLVDGQDTPLAVVESYRFYEVQKFLSITNHQWSSQWVIANGDVWTSLPKDLQAIVTASIDKHALLARSDIVRLEIALRDKLHRQGMTINEAEPASFRAKLGAFYAKYKGVYGDAAWSKLEKYAGKLA